MTGRPWWHYMGIPFAAGIILIGMLATASSIVDGAHIPGPRTAGGFVVFLILVAVGLWIVKVTRDIIVADIAAYTQREIDRALKCRDEARE
jgi:hypothetical protein